MPMTQDEKICVLRYAIENSKQVSAVVRNLPRVFCPHILGTRNLCGSVVAWQFAGLSTAGDLPNWRRRGLPVSHQQTHIEIKAKLAAARISIEDAADKAWQADDEELSNWLNDIASQIDEAIDGIECALSPEPVRLFGG
jgi:hypothetical protein